MSNGVISNILCNVSGKELIISNNILDVATAVDIAQFEHVTVRCNRKLVSTRSLAPTEENCPKTLNVPLMPKFTTFPGIRSYEEEATEEPSSAALGNFYFISNVVQSKLNATQIFLKYHYIILFPRKCWKHHG